MAFLLLIVIQCTSILNTDGHILEERLVNVSNIIARTPFTTITSCVMSCSENDACSVVGFSEMPAIDKKLDCLHLKNIEEVVNDDKSDDYVKAIILQNEDRNMTGKSNTTATGCGSFSEDKSDVIKDKSDVITGSTYKFFSAHPHEIKKNTLIGTMARWRKTQRVQFKFKIDVAVLVLDSYYNIIRFTNVVPNADNNLAFGSRMPFIFLRKSDHGIYLFVDYWLMKVYGNGYQKVYQAPFFNDWVHVTISQQFIDKQYNCMIRVGDEIFGQFVNTNPREFHDVKIYAGDDVHEATGLIKDLVIEDTFFPALQLQIKKNTLIGTMARWRKTQRVQFKFKIDVSVLVLDWYYNIIRFTNVVPNGDNNLDFGSRMPFIFLRKSDHGIYLFVDYWLMKVYGNGYQKVYQAPFFNDWIHVTISQQLIDKQYNCMIKVGDEIFGQFVNTNPREFHDVKIYAGDDVHEATGLIKDLVIEGYNGLKIN